MKHFLLCMLLWLAACSVQAQDISFWDESATKPGKEIDQVKYEVVYTLEQVDDTTRAHRSSFKEQMLLQVGAKCSAFFSYDTYQIDSMVAARMAQGDCNFKIPHQSKVRWSLFKNYPAAGSTTYLDRVADGKYAVEEKMTLPRWQLVPDSSVTLLGYACHLAVATFRGRTWKAWYTEDIPVDDGPWKLCGLPGLILKATDAQGKFAFTAVGLQQVRTAKPMTYKGEANTRIDRRSLNKIYKSYYADAIGYLLMSYPADSRNSITITDGDGKPLKHSKPQAYSLIEP
jgi:GLPGLI family protein